MLSNSIPNMNTTLYEQYDTTYVIVGSTQLLSECVWACTSSGVSPPAGILHKLAHAGVESTMYRFLPDAADITNRILATHTVSVVCISVCIIPILFDHSVIYPVFLRIIYTGGSSRRSIWTHSRCEARGGI